MCTSQESDKHQQQQYRVCRRNSGGANYAAMCVRSEAHLEFWVILASNLIKNVVSQESYSRSEARRPALTCHKAIK